MNNKNLNEMRRKLLLGGLAGGGALLARGVLGASAYSLFIPERALAAVPANIVNLSDFGGVPGASSSNIINAFNQAFARLKSLGGGTLALAPGQYNLGSFGGNRVSAITVYDLQNVIISATGAQMVMTVTSSSPSFFHFQNPNNVTVVGMKFTAPGTDLTAYGVGGVCLSVDADVPRSGFKTVNCYAENVLMFLRSYSDYKFTGFDIHASLKNVYYGLNPYNSGSFSRCDITCENVIRAFLGFGARNWDIKINCLNGNTAQPSSGYCILVPNEAGGIENLTINMTATGYLGNYRGLVHLAHQSGNGVSGSANPFCRNIKANVVINNATTPAISVFHFSHEDVGAGILSTTSRTWQNIALTGHIVGAYNGTIINSRSTSSSPGNSVYVSPYLAARLNMNALPNYFQVADVKAPQPDPAPQPLPVLVSLSALQASSNRTNAFYKYNFTGQIKFHRLYLDTDGNASTGFRKDGIGANYLIESGILYRYSGINGAWGWTGVKQITVSATASSMSLAVLRKDLGCPRNIKLIVDLEGTTGMAKSAVISQILNRFW